MRQRSQINHVSWAQAPCPTYRALSPAGQIDDPDEETDLDPLKPVGPDNELTAVRPSIVPSFADLIGAGAQCSKPRPPAEIVDCDPPVEENTQPDPIDAGSQRGGDRSTLFGKALLAGNRPKGGIPLVESPITPAAAPRKTRFARGSSHGVGLGSLGHIGKYKLRDKLGRGAFGVVFTAHDPSLDRDVAIKVLRPTHLTNQEIVQRFLQEARATARIAHPGIVTIHDCGRVETNLGETAFIAMELLTGETLTSRLARSGWLEPEVAAEIARQVASAIEAAHRVDVLHRDLKPDNIYMVPDPAMPSGERVKILDFGLAKLGREGQTQLQTVFGTPRYMSPEQCRSATQIDHRSDIYSLGCVLFELVTGRPPFEGDIRQLIERHQRMVAPRVASFVPRVSPALDGLIAEMLAKDPMERPQTMGAVQRALQHIITHPGHAPAIESKSPAPAELTVVTSEPQISTTPFERPSTRRPSEPPERPSFRRPSEPPERPSFRRPSEPPVRYERPATTDATSLSGEVLVPAGTGSPIVGVPAMPSREPERPSHYARFIVTGLLVLGLLLIAILAGH